MRKLVPLWLLAVAFPAAAEGPPLERFLNMRSSVAPSPSPDGKEVAFLTNVTGVMQAWRVASTGGWPHQVSYFPERVRGVWWSPKGDLLAFSVDVSGKERLQIWVCKPDGSGLRKLTRADDRIHNFGGWSPDGKSVSVAANLRDERYFDIHVLDVVTGAARVVKQADEVLVADEFSPDGKWLRYGRWNTNIDGDVFALELATGRTVHVNPHTEETRLQAVEWTEDSKAMLLATDQGRDLAGVARIALDAPGKLEWVFSPTWDVEGLAVSRGRVAVVVNEDGYSRIHLLDGGTFAPRGVAPAPDGVMSAPKFTRDGAALFVSVSGPTDNGDVFRWDAATGKVSRVTESDTAGIARESLVAPKLVKWKSHDGLVVPGWLYLPPGKKGPSPMVVWIHGGPESQERPGFNPVIQYLVSRGLGVYAPNIRGSAGYGKKYLGADNGAKRKAAIADVKAMAEKLVAEGHAQKGRLAVMGGSYGGYMTLAQLAFHPDLFRAGVDIVGIVNFETFLERTDPWRRPLREAEYGSLSDRKLLRELSPISRIDAIQAALLVIHGENDTRVPVHEARQVVEVLGKRGVKVEALYFPDEGHGLAKLPNRVKGYTAVADFLERQLGTR